MSMANAPLPPRHGIVPSLIGLYQRLADDDNHTIARPGFASQKVHFAIVLRRDGSLSAFRSVQQQNARGKLVPRQMLLFDSGSRSGTAIQPNFLWDNTGYVLGADDKGKAKRAGMLFDAFKAFHREVAETTDDESLAAVVRFLDSWQPEAAVKIENWDSIVGKNLVFQIEGETAYVHQSPRLIEYWSQRSQDTSEHSVTAPSLVDGRVKPIARLHPPIKGVAGAGTTGAAIVSFNQVSFESYGKKQSFNSPLSETEAFQYTTALNYLLADSSRRVQIGDATMLFWSDSPSTEAEDLAFELFAESPTPKEPTSDDLVLIDRIKHFLQAARDGTLADQISDANAGFYVLGLSPNKSRLSVRFWWNDSVEVWANRLAVHVDDLRIAGLSDNRFPVVRSLASQTVRDPKETPPELAGAITRSILQGAKYPDELWRSVVRRCRVDRNVTPIRAAILKACLNRSVRLRQPERSTDTSEIGVARAGQRFVDYSLNQEMPSNAYQIGRLLGALDLVHLASTDNRIKESAAARMLSVAVATPASVIPRLVKLYQLHRTNLPEDPAEARQRKVRTRRTFERSVADIFLQIQRFPSNLSDREQALALLGFYQQRQHFFRLQEPDPEAGSA
ncbi:CRISPR-associated protein [Stieleria neptunia]|uniref:CRISPR-associated protein n=1 Tax=Stieleria neptunia TaxID=2527979 RepID=A0A518HSF7_9BACT|nr:type I-C CRISPR-associated protein Cas8c/Csd1 [Stieleria neptunia]QDV43721.1 CRISPR-associated protein [Stieleria neptunia]